MFTIDNFTGTFTFASVTFDHVGAVIGSMKGFSVGYDDIQVSTYDVYLTY